MVSLLALYPTPATIVGAKVGEREVNWLLVAHVGIIGHDRILISLAKPHYTNQGIKESGKVSVALIDEAMLPRRQIMLEAAAEPKQISQKFFAWHEGENGTPIIDEAPLVLGCSVVDNYETETFDNFILKIDATYVEESKLDENGKPDYRRLLRYCLDSQLFLYFQR